MKTLFVLLLMFVSLSLQADEDIHILVYANYTPKSDLSYVKTKTGMADVVCFPIKFKKEQYNRLMVENAMKDYLLTKDPGTKVHEIRVSTFAEKKEAYDRYKQMTQSGKRGAKRISFTKSHLDKAYRKLMAEKKNEPAPAPGVEAKPTPKPEPVVPNKALDDIYD